MSASVATRPCAGPGGGSAHCPARPRRPIPAQHNGRQQHADGVVFQCSRITPRHHGTALLTPMASTSPPATSRAKSVTGRRCAPQRSRYQAGANSNRRVINASILVTVSPCPVPHRLHATHLPERNVMRADQVAWKRASGRTGERCGALADKRRCVSNSNGRLAVCSVSHSVAGPGCCQ